MTKSKSPASTSRWFRVIGERFDWIVKPGTMISFQKGAIGCRPKACIEAGLAGGVIEVISKPKGYSLDKSGNVVRNGH